MILELLGCKICGKICPFGDIRGCDNASCGLTSYSYYFITKSLDITQIMNTTFRTNFRDYVEQSK
jgi:Fe-S-cluster-containing hydrogenase component 2